MRKLYTLGLVSLAVLAGYAAAQTATRFAAIRVDGTSDLRGAMLAKLTTKASASGAAGLNLPAGAAPSSPVDGDLWTTTAGLFARINGATVGPYSAGSTSLTVSGVTKPSNTTRTSTTTASADPDLSTTLAAGTYSLQGHITFTAAAAGGLKANVFASQAVATSRFGFWRSQNGSTATTSVIQGASAPTTTITSATQIDDASGNAGSFEVRGFLIIPSSTTISITWAQQTSSGTGTVLEAGSWLLFTKIS